MLKNYLFLCAKQLPWFCTIFAIVSCINKLVLLLVIMYNYLSRNYFCTNQRLTAKEASLARRRRNVVKLNILCT